MTRRTNKLDFINESFSACEYLGVCDLGHRMRNEHGATNAIKCPYGQPGDVLWVRETLIADHYTSDTVVLSKYKADGTPVLYSTGDNYNGSVRHWDYKYDTLPSIFMPKSACRIFLEVTDVRVERLQDITEEDCIAEGSAERSHRCGGFGYYEAGGETEVCICQMWDDSVERLGFFDLWKSINGPESWEANPFVWCVSFKRIDKPENF